MKGETRSIAIRQCEPGDIEIIRQLFLAYTTWLGIDLTHQSFDKEVQDLPGQYDPQNGGSLLLAVDSRHASKEHLEPEWAFGCIAMRSLPAEKLIEGATNDVVNAENARFCELKRLYVSPQARGLGAGNLLMQEALKAAVKSGYTHCFLDSLPRLTSATKLYHHYGFTQTRPYNKTPDANVIFFIKQLDTQQQDH